MYFNDENACLENHARLTTDGTAIRPSDGHEEGCISDIKGEPEKKEKEMGQQKKEDDVASPAWSRLLHTEESGKLFR